MRCGNLTSTLDRVPPPPLCHHHHLLYIQHLSTQVWERLLWYTVSICSRWTYSWLIKSTRSFCVWLTLPVQKIDQVAVEHSFVLSSTSAPPDEHLLHVHCQGYVELEEGLPHSLSWDETTPLLDKVKIKPFCLGYVYQQNSLFLIVPKAQVSPNSWKQNLTKSYKVWTIMKIWHLIQCITD